MSGLLCVSDAMVKAGQRSAESRGVVLKSARDDLVEIFIAMLQASKARMDISDYPLNQITLSDIPGVR